MIEMKLFINNEPWVFLENSEENRKMLNGISYHQYDGFRKYLFKHPVILM